MHCSTHAFRRLGSKFIVILLAASFCTLLNSSDLNASSEASELTQDSDIHQTLQQLAVEYQVSQQVINAIIADGVSPDLIDGDMIEEYGLDENTSRKPSEIDSRFGVIEPREIIPASVPENVVASLEACSSQNFPFVYLNVGVVENGGPSNNLDASNFQCFENGTLQSDSFVVTPPEQGGGVRLADVVFIIDASGSMADEIAAVRDNANTFASALAASDVDFRLGLVGFGSSSIANPGIFNNGNLTSSVSDFQSFIDYLYNSVGGGTEPGFEAARAAVSTFSFRPGAQKIFILISDEDSDDRYKQETIDLLLANDVIVHTAVNCNAGASNSHYCDDSSIRGVTGGIQFNVTDPFDQILNTVSSQTSSTYVLRYRSSQPTFDGNQRNIQCQVIAPSGSDNISCSYTPGAAPQIEFTAGTLSLLEQSIAQGAPITIQILVTDDVAPFVQTCTLFYRPSGSTDPYTPIAMTSIGNNIYEGIIPGGVTPGLDFYVSATDGQVSSQLPSVDPGIVPFQIAVDPNYPPQITHTPLTSAPLNQDITFSATVVDSTDYVEEVLLLWRPIGELQYRQIEMLANAGNTYSAILPASNVQSAIQYFIWAKDNKSTSFSRGTADSPLRISMTVNVSITNIELQEQNVNTGVWQPLLSTADGLKSKTVDGNIVRAVITIKNDDDVGREVELAAKTNTVNIFNTRLTIQAGKDITMNIEWDTFGAAWEADGTAEKEASRLSFYLGYSLDQSSQYVEIQREVVVLPRPIVQVHGILSDGDNWPNAYERFAEFHPGWKDRLYALDLKQGSGYTDFDGEDEETGEDTWEPISDNAKALSIYIQTIKQAENASHIDLVAHSRGGLISRYYIHELMPGFVNHPEVISLVQLGTPNQGTPCAEAPAVIGAVYSQDLTPFYIQKTFNPYISNMNGVKLSIVAGDIFEHTCGYASWFTEEDESAKNDGVVPVEYTKYKDMSNHILRPVGHTNWLLKPPMIGNSDLVVEIVGFLASTKKSTRAASVAVQVDADIRQFDPPQFLYNDFITVPTNIAKELLLDIPESNYLSAIVIAPGSVTSRFIDPNGIEQIRFDATNGLLPLFRQHVVPSGSLSSGLWTLRLESVDEQEVEAAVFIVARDTPTQVACESTLLDNKQVLVKGSYTKGEIQSGIWTASNSKVSEQAALSIYSDGTYRGLAPVAEDDGHQYYQLKVANATEQLLCNAEQSMLTAQELAVLGQNATPRTLLPFIMGGTAPAGSGSPEPTVNVLAISSAEILIPQSAEPNTEYVMIASTEPFSATDTSALTYQWSPEPIRGQGTQYAIYSWSEIGEQTVEVTVDNGVNSKIVNATVNVQEFKEPVTISEISISGPNNGNSDQVLTFNAIVVPSDASTPLTFEWSPEPDSGQGTAQATYSWSSPGEYQIEVTTSNGASTVTDQYIINIQMVEPTVKPTIEPTVEPTIEPTIEPTVEPTIEPTVEPTIEPTVEPTVEPTIEPTVEPTLPIVANNDTAVMNEDESSIIDVLANDSSGNAPLNITSASTPSNGIATLSGNQIIYAPTANFNGVDSFTYTITDSAGNTADATVTVTVNAVNDPPQAVADTINTNEDEAATGNVLTNDSDIEGDPLTVNTTQAPTSGTLTLNADGTFVYTPNINFFGADSFVYAISDGTATDSATVTINITAVNDAPLSVDDSYTVQTGESLNGATVLANDSDPDSSTLTVDATPIMPPNNGTLTLNIDGTFIYISNSGFVGNDSFVYQVSDGSASSTATVIIQVTAGPVVNQPPIAVEDNATTEQDTPLNGPSVLTNDSDPEGGTLTVETTPVAGPLNGSVTINSNGTYQYIPNAGFTGNDSFTYRVLDNVGNEATATVRITVEPTTTPPPTGFQIIETFDDLSNGSLNGQDGWNATGGIIVTTDPLDGSNMTLQMSGSNQNAYTALSTPLTNADSGTLYMRMMRDGAVDGFGGLSDEGSAITWEAYETQFGATDTDPNRFRVRDGSQFDALESQFETNIWYCVWMTVDNSSNQYEVYVQGGAYDVRTKLSSGGQSLFAFRNGGDNPLTTFLARTGIDTSSSMYIDDIHIDVVSDTNFDQPSGNCDAATAITGASYGIGGSGQDQGYGIAVSPNGNINTTGSFNGTADFDPSSNTVNLSSRGGEESYLARYTSTGSIISATRFGDSGRDWGGDVVTDSAGNIYAIGRFSGTVDLDPGSGTASHSSSGDDDVYIVKLDVSGNYVWSRTIGGAGKEYGMGIAVDNQGNVYAIGYFEQTVDFDPGSNITTLSSQGMEDIFILKLNSSGNYQWARAFGNVEQDYGRSVTIDSTGSVYIAGEYRLTVDFDPSSGTENRTSAGLSDAFVLKMDTNGNYIWDAAFGGSGFDRIRDIAVDGAGNVYSTGLFNNTADFDPGSGSITKSSNGGNDLFVQKLDSSGNYNWVKTAGSPGDEQGYGIAIDSTNNVYIAGLFSGNVDFDPDNGTSLHHSEGNTDLFMQTLNSAGQYLNSWSAGGTGIDAVYDIVVAPAGAAYMTGIFENTMTSNYGYSPSLTSSGGKDIFIIKIE